MSANCPKKVVADRKAAGRPLKVAASRGNAQEIHMRGAFAKQGIDVFKDVEFVNIPNPSDQAAALRRGGVDLICPVEPFATQIRQVGAGKFFETPYDQPAGKLSNERGGDADPAARAACDQKGYAVDPRVGRIASAGNGPRRRFHLERRNVREPIGRRPCDRGHALDSRRANEPFCSVDDFWWCARVPSAALLRAAEADVFRPGLARREARWAIKALQDDPLPPFAAASAGC